MIFLAEAQYLRIPYGGGETKKICFEAPSMGLAQKIAVKKLSRKIGFTLNGFNIFQIKISRRVDNDNIIDFIEEEWWFWEFNFETRKREWKKAPEEYIDKVSLRSIGRTTKDDLVLFKQAVKLL
ncbi:MAG: hypothetical protein ABH805_01635 [Candidatus Nealsonbacteria bacterium]